MAKKLPALVSLVGGASCTLLLFVQVSPAPIAAPAFKVPAMWEYTAPLISPEKRVHDRSVAQKDPSIVYHQGNWHVFMTVKLKDRTAMEYCAFASWQHADTARRLILGLTESKYYCAPQVCIV